MISVYCEITVGLWPKSDQLCLGETESLKEELGVEIGNDVEVKGRKEQRIKKINMVQCGDQEVL